MEDDIYKGMLIPKGSIILANALYVPDHYSLPLDVEDFFTIQEYGPR